MLKPYFLAPPKKAKSKRSFTKSHVTRSYNNKKEDYSLINMLKKAGPTILYRVRTKQRVSPLRPNPYGGKGGVTCLFTPALPQGGKAEGFTLSAVSRFDSKHASTLNIQKPLSGYITNASLASESKGKLQKRLPRLHLMPTKNSILNGKYVLVQTILLSCFNVDSQRQPMVKLSALPPKGVEVYQPQTHKKEALPTLACLQKKQSLLGALEIKKKNQAYKTSFINGLTRVNKHSHSQKKTFLSYWLLPVIGLFYVASGQATPNIDLPPLGGRQVTLEASPPPAACRPTTGDNFSTKKRLGPFFKQKNSNAVGQKTVSQLALFYIQSKACRVWEASPPPGGGIEKRNQESWQDPWGASLPHTLLTPPEGGGVRGVRAVPTYDFLKLNPNYIPSAKSSSLETLGEKASKQVLGLHLFNCCIPANSMLKSTVTFFSKSLATVSHAKVTYSKASSTFQGQGPTFGYYPLFGVPSQFFSYKTSLAHSVEVSPKGPYCKPGLPLQRGNGTQESAVSHFLNAANVDGNTTLQDAKPLTPKGGRGLAIHLIALPKSAKTNGLALKKELGNLLNQGVNKECANIKKSSAFFYNSCKPLDIFQPSLTTPIVNYKQASFFLDYLMEKLNWSLFKTDIVGQALPSLRVWARELPAFRPAAESFLGKKQLYTLGQRFLEKGVVDKKALSRKSACYGPEAALPKLFLKLKNLEFPAGKSVDIVSSAPTAARPLENANSSTSVYGRKINSIFKPSNLEAHPPLGEKKEENPSLGDYQAHKGAWEQKVNNKGKASARKTYTRAYDSIYESTFKILTLIKEVGQGQAALPTNKTKQIALQLEKAGDCNLLRLRPPIITGSFIRKPSLPPIQQKWGREGLDYIDRPKANPLAISKVGPTDNLIELMPFIEATPIKLTGFKRNKATIGLPTSIFKPSNYLTKDAVITEKATVGQALSPFTGETWAGGGKAWDISKLDCYKTQYGKSFTKEYFYNYMNYLRYNLINLLNINKYNQKKILQNYLPENLYKRQDLKTNKPLQTDWLGMTSLSTRTEGFYQKWPLSAYYGQKSLPTVLLHKKFLIKPSLSQSSYIKKKNRAWQEFLPKVKKAIDIKSSTPFAASLASKRGLEQEITYIDNQKNIHKKSKAKRQRLESRQQKKRKRFYPRPNWLRLRLGINFYKNKSQAHRVTVMPYSPTPSTFNGGAEGATYSPSAKLERFGDIRLTTKKSPLRGTGKAFLSYKKRHSLFFTPLVANPAGQNKIALNVLNNYIQSLANQRLFSAKPVLTKKETGLRKAHKETLSYPDRRSGLASKEKATQPILKKGLQIPLSLKKIVATLKQTSGLVSPTGLGANSVRQAPLMASKNIDNRSNYSEFAKRTNYTKIMYNLWLSSKKLKNTSYDRPFTSSSPNLIKKDLGLEVSSYRAKPDNKEIAKNGKPSKVATQVLGAGQNQKMSLLGTGFENKSILMSYKQRLSLQPNKEQLTNIKNNASYAVFEQKYNTNQPKKETDNNLFRDFWIWLYNITSANTFNKQIVLDNILNHVSIPIKMVSESAKSKLSAIGHDNKISGIQRRQAITSNNLKNYGFFTKKLSYNTNSNSLKRSYWALNKTNLIGAEPLTNKRINTWSIQKLRNQSKNNKTKFLEKKIRKRFALFLFPTLKLDNFVENVGLPSLPMKPTFSRNHFSKNKSYKINISQKIHQKEIKLAYLANRIDKPSLSKNHFMSWPTLAMQTTQTRFGGNYNWWSSFTKIEHRFSDALLSPLILKTYAHLPKVGSGGLPDKGLASKNLVGSDGLPVGQKTSDDTFIQTACILGFHFCALISLISISQVRCFIKFHLILLHKLSNIYLQLIYTNLYKILGSTNGSQALHTSPFGGGGKGTWLLFKRKPMHPKPIKLQGEEAWPTNTYKDSFFKVGSPRTLFSVPSHTPVPPLRGGIGEYRGTGLEQTEGLSLHKKNKKPNPIYKIVRAGLFIKKKPIFKNYLVTPSNKVLSKPYYMTASFNFNKSYSYRTLLDSAFFNNNKASLSNKKDLQKQAIVKKRALTLGLAKSNGFLPFATSWLLKLFLFVKKASLASKRGLQNLFLLDERPAMQSLKKSSTISSNTSPALTLPAYPLYPPLRERVHPFGVYGGEPPLLRGVRGYGGKAAGASAPELIMKLKGLALYLFIVGLSKKISLAFFATHTTTKLKKEVLNTSFKIIDTFEYFLRVVYSFFEKPTELTMDWVAYAFLVEWSSDLITFTPENVEKKSWLAFSRMTRQSKILFLPFLSQKIKVGSSLSYHSTLLSSPALILSNFILGQLLFKRLLYLNDLFLDILTRPDTDLLNRQQKGTLFWDIWSDILIKAADNYNINIPSLSNIKEEQNNLIDRFLAENESLGYTNKNDGGGRAWHKVFFNSKTRVSYLEVGDKQKEQGGKGRTLPLFLTKKGLAKDISARIAANAGFEYVTYQSKETELFLDYHPPKSFNHVSAIQYYNIVQQPIGTLVCQIYSGILTKQISKNILVIGSTLSSNTDSVLDRMQKTLLIQALAGETEIKIITDNASRYAVVNRGFAVGIKLLKDVFEAIALNTPCLFLLEDIHLIGERRPLLISDHGDALGDDMNKAIETTFGSQSNGEAVHEKNQVYYQLSRHGITHYKKPFKGDFSLSIPTNHFSFDLFCSVNFSKRYSNFASTPANPLSYGFNSLDQTKAASSMSGSQADSTILSSIQKIISKRKISLMHQSSSTHSKFSNILSSYLQMGRNQLLSPPSTSPFTVLLLKEQKQFKPKKIVKELPWIGLPSEQLSILPRVSYSVRAKVAALADLGYSSMSAKLDMITDLLVIIDSVRGNRGFVVFATTHLPHILDPALRRPGRLDETISIPTLTNLWNRWEFTKASKPIISLNGPGFTDSPTFSWPTNFTTNTIIGYNGTLDYLDFLNFDLIPAVGHNQKANIISPIISQAQRAWPPRPYSQKGQGGDLAEKISDASLASKRWQKTTLYQAQKEASLTLIKKPTNKLNSWQIGAKIGYFQMGKKIIQTCPKVSVFLKKEKVDVGQEWILDLIDFNPVYNNLKTYESTTSLTESSAFLFNELQYKSLYASTNMIQKTLLDLLSGKLSELFAFKTLPLMGAAENPSDLLYSTTFIKQNFISLYGIDQTWRAATSLALSFVKKRYLYNQNLIVPKLLNFLDYSVIEEPPSPASGKSNILIPAKRYENYKKVCKFASGHEKKAYSSFFKEKLEAHSKQAYMKSIYNKNNFTKGKTKGELFPVSAWQLGSIDTTKSALAQPTSFNWYYQQKLLKRHRNYLTNQWWNGQLSEHNAESLFLSDIDWRLTFNTLASQSNKRLKPRYQEKPDYKETSLNVEKVDFYETKLGLYQQDILVDFPDADQLYNPKHRRWMLTSGYMSSWFTFDKKIQTEIVEHLIFECFIQSYNMLDQNRELLDYSVNKFLKTGLIKEIHYINIVKKFS